MSSMILNYARHDFFFTACSSKGVQSAHLGQEQLDRPRAIKQTGAIFVRDEKFFLLVSYVCGWILRAAQQSRACTDQPRPMNLVSRRS
jgi:hypothetical protein